jgi:hypothetical protein
MLASYTFSKSIDDTSAFLPTAADQNFPQDSHDYRLERALSSYDVPNLATMAFVYRIPSALRWARGFELSGIITAESGQPFTPELSTDNSNTGNSGGNFGIDSAQRLAQPRIGESQSAGVVRCDRVRHPAGICLGRREPQYSAGTGALYRRPFPAAHFCAPRKLRFTAEAQPSTP